MQNMLPAQARPSQHRWRRVRWALGLLGGIGVICWLGYTFEWRHVWPALNRVDYRWVGAGAAAVGLNLGARTLRWRALLDSSRVTIPATLQALALGQLLNLILPARLGDWGRAYLIVHRGYPSQVQALGTILLEKFWDIAALISLLLLLSFWQPLPPWLAVPARSLAIAGAVLFGAMLGLVWRRRRRAAASDPRLRTGANPGFWDRFGAGFSQPEPDQKAGGRPTPRFPKLWALLLGLEQTGDRLLAGLAGLRRPRILAAAWLWTGLVWLGGALTNLFLLQAFDLPLSVGAACLLLVVLHLGAAVPAVPGHVGVFEGLCVATLALFDVRAAPALAYGLVLHLIILLPPFIIGLWGLWSLDADPRRLVAGRLPPANDQ